MTAPALAPDEFVRGNLTPYGEAGRRMFAMLLMTRYVPSRVGSPAFTEVTQGRADRALQSKSFFSTCGELCMFLLQQMGYRGPILNRDLPKGDGDRKYASGKNMNYLVWRSRDEKVWVPFAGELTPKPGDICFISNGPPATEHVFVFKQELESGLWESFDGGQQFGGKKWNQCAEVKQRRLVGKKLGGRTLHGWVDISLLELTADAVLHEPPQST